VGTSAQGRGHGNIAVGAHGLSRCAYTPRSTAFNDTDAAVSGVLRAGRKIQRNRAVAQVSPVHADYACQRATAVERRAAATQNLNGGDVGDGDAIPIDPAAKGIVKRHAVE